MTEQMTDLLERVVRGDPEAATEIVDRFSPMLHAVTRRAGVPEASVHDVVQTTWLRLFEAPQSIREPEHLGGWLKTVVTREAWRTAGSERREVALGDAATSVEATGPGPEDRLVNNEEVTWLRRAIGLLPERQRQVLNALTLDPTPSYEEIAERTGMPVGSIGPTRARAVDQLRRLRQLDGTREAGRRVPGPLRAPRQRLGLAAAS